MHETTDLMGDSILSILQNLEADSEAQGWDAPPSLYYLQRQGPITLGADLPGRPALMMIALQQMPVPVDAWEQAGHPAELLQTLVGFFELPGNQIPDLLGFAICVEAWSAIADPGEALGAELQAAAEAHELHLHPARKECRLVHCADIAGQNYLVMRLRDDPELVIERSHLDGIIPDALHRLVEVAQPAIEPPT